MKYLTWLSWLSLLAAIFVMVLGAIDFVVYGTTGGFLGVAHTSTFFLVANTFLLACIAFTLLSGRYSFRKE